MKPTFFEPNKLLGKWIPISAILVTTGLLIGGCIPTNHHPVITSLKAEPETLPPSGSCQIKCVASDKDGDELSYEWLASKGHIDGDGATVAWNAPDSEGIYNIVVKVNDGNGSEAIDYMTIIVRVNNPPTIASLTADVDWIIPSSSCQIECTAEDPDDDDLSYTWSASGGDISGRGSVVTWTAPAEVGLYDITVIVTDGHGDKDTASLAISVALDHPPLIESLIILPKEPKYLKEYEGGYKILKGKSCKIKCVASDPEDDKLSYQWISDGGSISGKGPVITWTAPTQGSKVTITIIVSDSSGGAATKSIAFTVKTCSCAFR